MTTNNVRDVLSELETLGAVGGHVPEPKLAPVATGTCWGGECEVPFDLDTTVFEVLRCIEVSMQTLATVKSTLETYTQMRSQLHEPNLKINVDAILKQAEGMAASVEINPEQRVTTVNPVPEPVLPSVPTTSDGVTSQVQNPMQVARPNTNAPRSVQQGVIGSEAHIMALERARQRIRGEHGAEVTQAASAVQYNEDQDIPYVGQDRVKASDLSQEISLGVVGTKKVVFP